MKDTVPLVSNEEKKAVWDAYRQGKPFRVPVLIATNPRIILLDPKLNTKGYTFERYFQDPYVMLEVQLQHTLYRASVLHRYTDDPTGPPEVWRVGVDRQNIYEAAFFGAPIVYRPGQVPDTKPILDDSNKERIFDVDIENPLERGFFREALEMCLRMKELAKGMEFQGRPVEVLNYTPSGTDGPLTVAANLRGQGIFLDLLADPDYAMRLMAFITQAAINRVYALRRYWQDETIPVGLADDSVQLISTKTYREMVMPHHRRFYDTFLPNKPRSIHLCGDATRHFRTMRDELNVRSFDTGFPVDFAWLRRELGPDVEILGGPPVSLLLHGTPEAVYERTKEILLSGIKEGGRFILREGNNLPPMTPEDNLAAMYKACLDYGWY
jgi:uroporphyrinogen-III decarboxylase